MPRSAGIIDDLAVADSQGDYSYMRNLTFQYSLNQHFDNKIRRPGFSALLTRFEDYCASFSKVLVALRTTEIGKNEDMSASTFMSENSLPKELLAPMLNLFTWGDHAEEAKQTGTKCVTLISGIDDYCHEIWILGVI